MSPGRNNYIDNAKGILIILMVFGHVFLDDALVDVVEWVYTFHMPAFFIINGMLFHYSSILNKNYLQVFVKYILTIIIPLIFSECVGALTYIVRYGFTQSIFGFAYNTLTYHFNNGPDWFLVVLFLADMLFVALYKMIKGKNVQICISFTIMLVAFLLPDTAKWLMIVRSIGISFGFVCIGYYGKHLFYEYGRLGIALIAAGITVVVLQQNGSVSLNIARVNNPFLFLLGAISGTYLTIYVAQKIKLPALAYIGKNSLIVMIMHQAIMLPIRYYTHIAEFDLLMGMGVLVITIALQFPLSYLINRFLPFCVGKPINKTCTIMRRRKA